MTPVLGIGLSLDYATYEYTVGLGVSIPHPTVFNRATTASGLTASSLTRTDRGINISAVITPRTPDAVRVQLSLGPTYFHAEQEMVEHIAYDQVFNLLGTNLVTITGTTPRTVSGSAWGFHAGGDVAYFFAKHVGVGGMLRVSRGTVAIDREPLSTASADLTVGWVTAGAGLRLRF